MSEVEVAFLRTDLINVSWVWAKLARERCFQNSNEKSVDNFKGLINWVAMSSNEGLTLKTSALEFLHVGQFTLWTQSIKLSLFCNNPPPPAQCLRFSGNYPTFILNFLTKSVTTSDTWWCRFYEEEKSNRGKEIKKRTALEEHWNARCDCYFESQFSCVHIHYCQFQTSNATPAYLNSDWSFQSEETKIYNE